MAYLDLDAFYLVTVHQLQSAPAPESFRKAHPESPEIEKPYFYEYEPVIKRNLFKTGSAKPEDSKNIDIGSLDKTRLNLKLYGTVICDMEPGFAVIENADLKIQDLYKEGDQVSGATLKLILRDKVILSVGGNDEILEMEDEGVVRKKVIRRTARKRIPERAFRTPVPGMSNQKIVVKRTDIDEAVENISELMTQAAVSPHPGGGVSGDPEGLSLSNIKNGSIFTKMGLRNGDVILRVNGKQIRTLDDALALYENLRTSKRVELQVSRRGRTRELQYVIE